ncbi:DUF1836 domain-containing protein [Alkalicoccus luteus]|nr:DUF1836 domain-containing protein [Alkalicoccus luteus]
MSLEQQVEAMMLDRHVNVEQLPDLDLYMDQVIQLFEIAFQDLKRDEKEKIMTKTMINNYAKGHLLLPAKNKRYTKEHVMMISMIYEMKGALSLKDIKKVLDTAGVTTQEPKNGSAASLYRSYLQCADEKTEIVRGEMVEQAREMEQKEADPYVQQVLLILSFIHQSNLYRRAAEKMIDSLA